jgi:hypothetical protein
MVNSQTVSAKTSPAVTFFGFKSFAGPDHCMMATPAGELISSFMKKPSNLRLFVHMIVNLNRNLQPRSRPLSA